MVASNGQVSRGALIVFEGCDRTGKSTQAQRLVDRLASSARPAKLLKFPDRSSAVTGAVIDSYLRQTSELGDAAVHLLFSANRWEAAAEMRRSLEAGTTLVVDRYAFSGVAFTAAKEAEGLGVDWCRGPDVGLPAPDVVLFLDLSPEEAERRAGFGGERYEKLTFQTKVRAHFLAMKEPNWKIIDASKTMDDISAKIGEISEDILGEVAQSPIGRLWT